MNISEKQFSILARQLADAGLLRAEIATAARSGRTDDHVIHQLELQDPAGLEKVLCGVQRFRTEKDIVAYFRLEAKASAEAAGEKRIGTARAERDGLRI